MPTKFTPLVKAPSDLSSLSNTTSSRNTNFLLSFGNASTQEQQQMIDNDEELLNLHHKGGVSYHGGEDDGEDRYDHHARFHSIDNRQFHNDEATQHLMANNSLKSPPNDNHHHDGGINDSASGGAIYGKSNSTRTQILFHVVKSSIGWLSFSIVFNVLNTIVYSALYPKILHNVASDGGAEYSTAFSIINTVTTLASALSLPILGSLVDNLKLIRTSMMVTMYLGILATIGLFFTDKLPHASPQDYSSHLAICEIVYILAMFFLRFSVMNNNALLPCFDKKNMMILSLLGNFIGFGVNLVGLLVLAFVPSSVFSGGVWDISRENWWVLVFTSITIIVSLFVILSPNGVDKVTLNPEPISNEKAIPQTLQVPECFSKLPKYLRGLGKVYAVVAKSFKSLGETFIKWRSNEQYYHCWIFLFSYLFFSTAGTVVTIYLGPLFIDIYNFGLEQEVLLNLYFKIAMVGGVIGGVIFEKLFKIHDIYVLAGQNSLFGVLTLSIFITISMKVEKYIVLAQFLVVGFLYAWNASVARGLMSKLIPLEKKCEFMGFFSTFTYLGISVTSAVYSILSKLKLPQTLLLVLFIWLIPAFLFLAVLKKSLNKKELREKQEEEAKKMKAIADE